MLTLLCSGNVNAVVPDIRKPIPDNAVWYDLNSPTEEEIRHVEKATGICVPPRDQINRLGLSNRNRLGADALHLHMALYADGDRIPACSPLGLVLTQQILVTVRFAASKPVDSAPTAQGSREGPDDGVDAFVTLLEAVTNDIAEQMQEIATDMAHLSTRVFIDARLNAQALRSLIMDVGRLERRLTRYRTSQLGMARILDFVDQRAPKWIEAAALLKLKIVHNDLRSLDKFDEQLTAKLQFLLDAILGFINTDQNDIIRVLTVASVVTIPPVILAGIWGMNFRHMPDLVPVWAYPMALFSIGLSIIVPLLWFWKLGWLSKQ
ncbi:MAG: CorA family divalent cation transporter [Rhodanobacteraceae bacterium]